jgi:hypothetical protein
MSHSTQGSLNKDYKYAPKKRAVQADIYSYRWETKYMGFGGNNVGTAAKFLKSNGFTDISLYEIDPQVYDDNKKKGKKAGINYNLRCGLTHPYNKDTFHEIDFCKSILRAGAEPFIAKYTDNFAFTFAFRMGRFHRKPFKETIDLFLKLRGEERKGRGAWPVIYRLDTDGNETKDGCIKVYRVSSDKGTYKVYKYKDTSIMLVITPEN